jgi:4-oxalomesaconate hydratase
MTERLLVIGAHAADFVWRSAGAVATVTQGGGQAMAVALSYGERGESAELWSRPGTDVASVKTIRHSEAEQAARILNAEFTCFDLGDYPLFVDEKTLAQLADLIRDFAPTVLITHTESDPFNPDHPVAHQVAIRAQQLAVGSGRAAAFRVVPQPRVVLFEPHYTEASGFVPDVYLDISAVALLKQDAMAAIQSQAYMPAHQDMRSAERAWQARRISGRGGITAVEVFQRFTPQVVAEL